MINIIDKQKWESENEEREKGRENERKIYIERGKGELSSQDEGRRDEWFESVRACIPK